MSNVMDLPAPARPLGRARGLVALQIALSVPFQLGFVWFVRQGAGLWQPTADDPAARLAFAVQGSLVGATVLLVMIGFIAGARPIWAATIGGSPDATQLEIHVRVQRNTLEQLVLLVISQLALAVTLPREDLSLLPALVALFVVARVMYWIGYVRDPMYRTFGFVATFYPNIYAMLFALYLTFG